MSDEFIEELKQFRNSNNDAFFNYGVIETRMYINSSGYVSFEIKTFRTSDKINSDYQKRFIQAIDNFKKLYNFNDSKYFNEYRDNYNVQEYRYFNITNRRKDETQKQYIHKKDTQCTHLENGIS